MRIRYLGWAGLEIEAEGETAVLDVLQDTGPLARFIGDPRTPLHAPEAGRARVALVTHLHSDHADPRAIRRALAPDGVLLRPAPAVGEGLETAGTAVAEAGLARLAVPARVVAPWQTVRAGVFELTAVPAVDGLGDPQIGWVVAANGRRIVAYGDTLFHGHWWLTRTRLGPFDAAFLPVNGAVVDFPHRRPPSPVAADMTPEQAAAAASLLQPRVAVAVHYGTFHNPPTYAEVARPAETFVQAAAVEGIGACVLEPGEWLG